MEKQKIQVQVFAYNLRTPTHMEWTKDGRLLVSEHTSGEIKDITFGGDCQYIAPIAYGLKGPSSILPLNDGRILVSESWTNRIVDISRGGNMTTNAIPFAVACHPYSLIPFHGALLVSERSGKSSNQITKIDGQGYSPFITNVPAVPMPGLEGLSPFVKTNDLIWMVACTVWGTGSEEIQRNDEIFISSSALGQILKVSKEGGDFFHLVNQGNLIAWGLDYCGGMIIHPFNGLLYVTQPQKGSVMCIHPYENQDYRFDPPVVKGLGMPTCVRFSLDGCEMFVCSMVTGTIWKITGFV